jgi:hypothetical protein
VAKVNRVSDGDTVIATTSESTKLRLRLPGKTPLIPRLAPWRGWPSCSSSASCSHQARW